MDPNDAVGGAIRLLERSLAELVDEVVSDEVGPDWVRKVFPHLKDELTRRQRAGGPLKFGLHPSSSVGYLYLGELKHVLVSKQFWPHFEEVFDNKERLSHLLDIVQEIRPAWAHPAATTIDPDTACYVLLTVKKLLSPISPDGAEHVATLFQSVVTSLVEEAASASTGVFGLLSKPGALDTMRFLADRPLQLSQSEVARAVESEGFDAAADLLSSMCEAGWCVEHGGRLALSAHGRRVFYLACGLEGGDLRRVIQVLMDESPRLRMYELVTEGMTQRFIEELYEDPTFGSLYFACPWIDLDENMRAVLQAAIDRAEQHTGQEITLIVITRPPSGTPAWKERLEGCITWLRALRADVHFLSTLHTKLFLREPSSSGGNSVALFGSENLTRGGSLELGIKIRNDSSVTRQLLQYFFDLYSLRN